MAQVFRPYWELEEHTHGMWRQLRAGRERDNFIGLSESLMRDRHAFLNAMLRAVREWPNSCESAMTTTGLNKRAWMGHAGCCVNHGAPEELTRLAWHRLDHKTQALANEAADKAIRAWETLYYLGERQEMLF